MAQDSLDLDALIGAQPDGQHRIIRILGRGGMGAVYEAVHAETRHRVAIKFLFPEYAEKDRWVERLFKEAQAVNLVDHPGVVRIYSCGFFATAQGRLPYLLMEYLDGEALFVRVRGKRRDGELFTLQEVLRIGRQAADTLAAVHDKGIIHRDLKPENLVLVRDPEVPGGERVKLLDFGIAKFHNPSLASRETTAQRVMGTPIYMSPEQCRGVPLSGRSDVYALGVMLYELIGGQVPFDHAEAVTLMSMHLRDQPPPLRRLRPEAPPEVVDLVECMLGKDPAQRPSMAEVAARLEQLLFESQAPTAPGLPSLPSLPNLPTLPMPSVRTRAAASATALVRPQRPRPPRTSRAPSLVLLGLLGALGAGVGLQLQPAPVRPVAPAAPALSQAPAVVTAPVGAPPAVPPKAALPSPLRAEAEPERPARAAGAPGAPGAPGSGRAGAPRGRSRREAIQACTAEGRSRAEGGGDCAAGGRAADAGLGLGPRHVPLPAVQQLSPAERP